MLIDAHAHLEPVQVVDLPDVLTLVDVGTHFHVDARQLPRYGRFHDQIFECLLPERHVPLGTLQGAFQLLNLQFRVVFLVLLRFGFNLPLFGQPFVGPFGFQVIFF